MSEVKVETDDQGGGFLSNVLRGTQEAARRQRERNQQAQGINVIPAFWSNAALDTASILGNTLGQTSRFLRGQSSDPVSNWGSRLLGGPQETFLSVLGGGTPPPTKGKGGSPSYLKEQQEVPTGLTAAEWLGQNMGSFDETPYRNYMDFLMQQDEETMARINAMYNQLAESAGANMQRVADVYDSARIQSGDVFGGSAQNIEDAYSSASQQAADQMARLGIEAAAPAVMNPMALSQAEAVSGIERAGAGALDALTRYGASAQDFGGQMAQVGQQQGLEVSNQILRDMQQRQAEAMFQMEQARAGFNPYAQALDRLQFENMYNEPMIRAQEKEQQRAFEMAKQQVQLMAQYDNDIMRDVRELMSQGYDYNGAIEIITNTRMFNPYQQ